MNCEVMQQVYESPTKSRKFHKFVIQKRAVS